MKYFKIAGSLLPLLTAVYSWFEVAGTLWGIGVGIFPIIGFTGALVKLFYNRYFCAMPLDKKIVRTNHAIQNGCYVFCGIASFWYTGDFPINYLVIVAMYWISYHIDNRVSQSQNTKRKLK